MNIHIAALHGREMLRRIRLFEGTRIKIARHIVPLFINKIRSVGLYESLLRMNLLVGSKLVEKQKILSQIPLTIIIKLGVQ